ncbi:hypothetical protein DIPPA_31984 [Diplonema papillatum]|nr:hypothetical protein DIPPA_31984 [Diplonema papillatum]
MVVAIIQGLVRAAALGGSAALGACVPRLPLFCLRWAFLGFTSCCVAGCGAANLLLFLVQYLAATRGRARTHTTSYHSTSSAEGASSVILYCPKATMKSCFLHSFRGWKG